MRDVEIFIALMAGVTFATAPAIAAPHQKVLAIFSCAFPDGHIEFTDENKAGANCKKMDLPGPPKARSIIKMSDAQAVEFAKKTLEKSLRDPDS
jgi:hypothetical protein